MKLILLALTFCFIMYTTFFFTILGIIWLVESFITFSFCDFLI